MDYLKIREKVNKGVRIEDIELRVTYYARVSSNKDEQLNSLENQIQYFEKYIKNNPKWKYVKGYIDEGISGSSVKNRKEFLNMIEDSKLGLFDLILTKEVSRFSRNLYDSVKYTEELLKNNVGVYFETNNINTFDNNSEFLLNLMSSLAQEEVKRLSSRIKWGAANAQKRGIVLGNKTFGYKKKKGILEIDKKESEVVKLIFDLYTSNNYGIDKISYILSEKGILNSKGNMIDSSTIKRIIRNPKYKGYYQGHTTEVIDYKTKKRVKIKEDDQVIFKTNDVPAIVSEEIWNKANDILNSRKKYASSNIKKYELSGLMYCSEHNKIFIRSTGSKRSKNTIWACNEYMKYHLKKCKSPLLKEKEILKILRIIFFEIFDEETYISDMKDYYKYDDINYENKKVDKLIKRLNELYILEYIDKKELERKINELNRKKIDPIKYQNLNDEILKKFNKKENISLYISYFIENIVVEKKNDNRKDILLKIKTKNIDNIKIKRFTFDNFSNKYEIILL